MNCTEWDLLAFKAYFLIYFNDLNSFQTKSQVDIIREVVGSLMYLAQSKSYYEDTTRSARFKINYYIREKGLSKEELEELFKDMYKLVSKNNFFGKRQKKFLEVFADLSAKHNMSISQILDEMSFPA